jgi:hypothetical protein
MRRLVPALILAFLFVIIGCGGGTANANNGGAAGSNGAGGGNTSCSQIAIGQGASLNGFVPFAASNLWNQDVSAAPVDPNSTAIINYIGPTTALHPDFGAGLYNGSIMGIPYVVVGAGQALVNINFTAYGAESDPGPMPIPANAPIEGDPSPSGDQHVLVIDQNQCWIYELYLASPAGGGAWNAGSASVWDMLTNEQRPYSWTSADAAGLPIFPGLLRYDEVAAGSIRHAIRFTLQHTRAAFTPPASHWAANSSDPSAAPMGMRMRLKSSFDISAFSQTNQVILQALKKYGIILADNGSSMYLTGAPDDRWDNNDLHNLSTLKASDFEVIAMNPIYTAANVPTGNPPQIASFATLSSSISKGQSVILNWSVSGASYLIISPDVAAVRGSSVSVKPSQTTTYTLYATGPFGRSQAAVTVSVH